MSALTENVGLKVTSLLIAMALFGGGRGAGSVQRSLAVSLLARLPPPSAHRVLLTDLPDRVRVTVRGSPSLVGSLRPDELGPVQVDLSDGHRPLLVFDPALFQLPGGVQLAAIEPSSLQLTWDAFVDRVVPVRPTFSGVVAAGNRLAADPDVNPPNISVSGPALYVGALPIVRTDAIDITGLGPGNYQRRVALDSPRPRVRYEENAGVSVAFTIQTEIVDRRFERVPVSAVGPARVDVRPPVVTVIVRGSPQRLSALDPREIVPTVDVETAPMGAMRAGTRSIVHLQHVPDGAALVSIEPGEVIVVPSH